MRHQWQRGFTLIELMVIVAIIGILAAVAIPAFMKNARKAKTAEATTNVKKMYEGARSYYEEELSAAADVCELLRSGRISAVLAARFGIDADGCLNGDSSTGGGRSAGYTFVYVPSGDRKHFAIYASPAAPGRSGDSTVSTDEHGTLEITCPPGTTYDQQTELCEPADNFLSQKALEAVRRLNTLSGGTASAAAQQFVDKARVLAALEALDTNGDAALSLDEITTPDLRALGRALSTQFGRARKPGPPPDNREVEAAVSGYLATVRADAAPGIADAPAVSVPIDAMSGDVAAFLARVK